MKSRLFMIIALSLLLLSVVGCRHRRPPESVLTADATIAYGLGNPDADKRKSAASTIRNGDYGPEAAPHLIKAINREPEPDVKGEMLIALGETGAPEGRPVIESMLNDQSKVVRRAAQRAMDRYEKRIAQSHALVGTIPRLTDAEWKVRKSAAEAFAGKGGPPAEATAPLVAAAGAEKDPRVLEPLLVAIGATGAPEAKPILEAHMEDTNTELRRAAHRGMKRWLARNGHNVRGDVATAAAGAIAALPAASAAAADPDAPATQEAANKDGCGQFKAICAEDPFDLDKCRSDMKPLTFGQQQVWADCVNDSTASCQKAHDTCIQKAKSASK